MLLSDCTFVRVNQNQFDQILIIRKVCQYNKLPLRPYMCFFKGGILLKKQIQQKKQSNIPYNTNINSRKTNTMKIYTKIKKKTKS